MNAKNNVRKEKEYTCGNCGWTVKEEDRFCPHCGSSFVDDEKEDEDELEYKCNECGGIVNKDDRFCSHCGEPFDEDDEEDDEDNDEEDDEDNDEDNDEEDDEEYDESYHYIGVQFESKIYPGTFYGNIYTYKTKTNFKYNQIIYVPTRLGLRKARIVEERKDPNTIQYDLDNIMEINDNYDLSQNDSDSNEETHEEVGRGKFNNGWRADTIDETDNYSLKKHKWSNGNSKKYIYQYDEDRPRSRSFTEEDYYDPDALIAGGYSEGNYNEFYHGESIENDDRTIGLSDEEY